MNRWFLNSMYIYIYIYVSKIYPDAEEQPDVTLVDGAAGDASKSSGKRGRSAKVKKEEPDTEDDKKVVSKGRSTASKSRGKAKFEEGGEEVRGLLVY